MATSTAARTTDGDTMSMATRTDAQPSAPHDADSHDLIRVQGARENNLKDVSVEIPKRRLTVFTGVSGSGKSSLVFGTIAAESQRMINETYSAFVQGFMPTLARPDVDVLEGLTTAIIVDQERMGANARSTVGTVTDANAMLRILFSRLGQPHIGSPQAFSFNIPTVQGSGAITIERGGDGEDRRARPSTSSAACARAARAWAPSPTSTCTQIYDDGKSLAEGAITVPGYTADGWTARIFAESGFFDPDKPIRDYTEKELHDFLYKRADQGQGRRHQHHLRGPGPEDAEVVALQGRRRDAAAHPRVRRAGGRPSRPAPTAAAPGSTRRARSSKIDGHQHRRRLRDADQRPGRVGRAASTSRRSRRCSRRCGRSSTRSSRSGSATSRSTARRARCRAARRSAPR